MGEETRERIENLVRKSTLAFYDESMRAEMASTIEVDYLTQVEDGHKMTIFAQSHEYENERPVWAVIEGLTIDLEPKKVDLSSYHVTVEISETDYGHDEFGVGDNGQSD